MSPWVFVPMVMAAYTALRAGPAAHRSWYCLCLAAPAILLFTIVPLWGDLGLPHWQMPGWLMLYPVLGDCLAREAQARRSAIRKWAIWSTASLVLVALLVVAHANTGFLRLAFPTAFAKGDPTLEALDWRPLHDELQRRGLLDKPGLFVITDHTIDAGKIDQALHDTLPIKVLGASKQYAFRYDATTFIGRDALIIVRSSRMDHPEKELGSYFQSIEKLPPFAFSRSGLPEIDLQICYGHTLMKPLPSPYDE